MGNIFLTSALGALMMFSPQSELVDYDQITIRENDIKVISIQAEINSTHLSYRDGSHRIKPVEKIVVSEEKQIAPAVRPDNLTQTASVTYQQPVPSAPLDALIDQYAAQYGARADIMKIIMQCESGGRPSAVNGPFAGLFQFLASTWSSNRKAMGLDPNPELRFNPEEAIKTAAFKMGRDGYGAWPACSNKAFNLLNL